MVAVSSSYATGGNSATGTGQQEDWQSDTESDDPAAYLPEKRRPSDACPAGPAATPQGQEAYKGNQLIPGEGAPASLAVRPPAERRAPSARGDDAREGPQGAPDDRDEEKEEDEHEDSLACTRSAASGHLHSQSSIWSAYTRRRSSSWFAGRLNSNSVSNRLLAPVSRRDGRAVLLFALFAYVLFSLFDWITTALALAAGGGEGNPVAASVFGAFGNIGLLLFKLIVVGIIIAILIFIPRRIMSLRVATWIGAIFAVTAAVIVIHNVEAYASLLQQHHGPTYQTTAPNARLV